MKVDIGDYSESSDTRSVSVEISDHDMFCMASTLAHIIKPMLERQREYPGVPYTDPADVPEIEDREADAEHGSGRPPGFSEARWRWMLGEMIWAFDAIASGACDLFGSEDRSRVQRATTLFGKYFQTLWT